MSKAKAEEQRPNVLLGRPSNNVSIGIVGMPNIGKCWARGTLLYRADGQLVRVEDIKAGDRLLGDDGGVRLVQAGSLNRGVAPLVEFVEAGKDDWGRSSFRVNRDHVLVLSQHAQAEQQMEGRWEVRDLSLSRCPVQAFPDADTAAKWCRLQCQQLIEMTVQEFLTLPVAQQRELRCVRPAAVTADDRPELSPLQAALGSLTSDAGVSVDDAAYVLGAWLTAGSDAFLQGGVFDKSARWRALQEAGVDAAALAERLSHSLGMISAAGPIGRQVNSSLWLLHSVSTRLRLLAGFVDLAGVRVDVNSHRISLSQLELLQHLHTLALSVGLRVHSRTVNAVGEHSMTLTGDLHSAVSASPASLPSWSFDAVECGEAEYFGFSVDGNSRLLLADLTITHNSSLYNALSRLSVPAENYPFCTIDPSTARVAVPDERFDFLCTTFKPASKVPAVLTITDIAGLVKGANEGKGLGNAFLSHIQAVDAIFHLVRAFKDKEIEHVEGSVDPIRDLDIISEELILKDYSRVHDRLEVVKRMVDRGQDKTKKQDIATLTIADQLLAEKKDIRSYKWKPDDIDVLNELQLLTAKPVVYLVNIGEDEYYQQKNKWLGKIKEWVTKRDPQSKVIPFSVVYEAKLAALGDDEGAKAALVAEKKVPSQMPKIITTGYHALDLIHFFTAGEDEVRGWTIKRGTLAPAAAGVIHTDFQKAFIAAEVMAYEDFKEAGNETAVKAAGKYRTKGKEYVVVDGDIMFFKHNAGGAKKK